jgi:hypothetical protein
MIITAESFKKLYIEIQSWPDYLRNQFHLENQWYCDLVNVFNLRHGKDGW